MDVHRALYCNKYTVYYSIHQNPVKITVKPSISRGPVSGCLPDLLSTWSNSAQHADTRRNHIPGAVFSRHRVAAMISCHCKGSATVNTETRTPAPTPFQTYETCKYITIVVYVCTCNMCMCLYAGKSYWLQKTASQLVRPVLFSVCLVDAQHTYACSYLRKRFGRAVCNASS